MDVETVLTAAAELGVAVELNANPNRLDLNDVHVHRAKELGVPVVMCCASDGRGMDELRGLLAGKTVVFVGGMTRSELAALRWLASRDSFRRDIPAQRTGRIKVWLIVLLAVIGSGGWWGWKSYSDDSWNEIEERPITVTVEKKSFVHEVIERGEVESSSNVDIRCEVQARNSGGTTILEIVPEGSQVKEGDFLVRLDDSALQTELLQQQIVYAD